MKSGLTWAFTTWLSLIALQALATRGSAGRVGSALSDINSIIERLLDADVAAIPDRRSGATASTTTSTTTTVPNAYGFDSTATRFPTLYKP